MKPPARFRLLTSDFRVFAAFPTLIPKNRLQRRRSEEALKNLLLGDLKLGSFLRYDQRGKPYLALPSSMHISISHSGGAAAVALGDREIGVDIQYFSERLPRIIRRISSHEELSFIQTPEYAHYLWCAKEAAYKAAGSEGLSMRRDISVQFRDGFPAIARLSDGRILELTPFRFRLWFGMIALTRAR
ncbi:MAG: 4'-phosphopantetheinyl transferase superfamily protein [Chlorobi bacterium]|nr:4'-phosphopantetheinyl transferase superfamily protein [Chlorobiota bacterium]